MVNFIHAHAEINEHTSALRITSERDLEGLHPRLSASESTSNPSTDEAMGTQSS